VLQKEKSESKESKEKGRQDSKSSSGSVCSFLWATKNWLRPGGSSASIRSSRSGWVVPV